MGFPDCGLRAERPRETYGEVHQFSIKLLNIDKPVIAGPGQWPNHLKMVEPLRIGNWKNIRSGDGLLIEVGGQQQKLFVEWIRIDHGTPSSHDGRIVDSVNQWERTVLLTPASPREWWGRLGPVLLVH